MDKYTKLIYWSDEDNCFIAEAPELPGCMADGISPEEALRNISTVISEWIETAESLVRVVPQPAGRKVYA